MEIRNCVSPDSTLKCNLLKTRILMVIFSVVPLACGIAPHARASGKPSLEESQSINAKSKKMDSMEKIKNLTAKVQEFGFETTAKTEEVGPKLRGFLKQNNYSPAAVRAVMDGFLGKTRLHSLKISILETVSNTAGRPLTLNEAQIGEDAARKILLYAKKVNDQHLVSVTESQIHKFGCVKKAHPQQIVDLAVSPWLENFSLLLDTGIPSAYHIWKMGQQYLNAGDQKGAAKCERLNYLLHNSSIPNSAIFGENVHFAYGGIGTIIHKGAEVGNGVTIGSNVTLGGGSKARAQRAKISQLTYVPYVADYSYLSTGCKILGGVQVGPFSIVGANSVVLNDVPPLTIVAGVPAKKIKSIAYENCLSYRGYFPELKTLSNEEFLKLLFGQ